MMHGGISRVPLSSAASTTDGTWCTVHDSGTDPDDNGQIFCIISIDFIPFLICCKVFFSVVSQLDSSSRTVCSRSTVAVHSHEPRSRAV